MPQLALGVEVCVHAPSSMSKEDAKWKKKDAL